MARPLGFSVPQQPSPLVYVRNPIQWEYKRVLRPLEAGGDPMSEAELNDWGQRGWELCGLFRTTTQLYFYFKREVQP
ncbi:MAG TPA: hypothetical protein VHP83_05875 [Aggregatilineaceae bacterium]|nr:hypothetical protein [Aggregatilineaceae bacterium]